MTELGEPGVYVRVSGAGHADAGQPGRSTWMGRIETGDGVVREIRASTLADKVPPRISMPMSVVDRLSFRPRSNPGNYDY
jgi:hypothetical protein